MDGSLVVYDSVMNSNLPSKEKSIFRQYMDKVTNGKITKAVGRGIGMNHLTTLGHTVRATGESTVTGATLAILHAELPTGLDIKGAPADGILAALAALAAIAGANHELSRDALNVSNSAMSIFAFRKTYDFIAEKKLASGSPLGGTFGPSQSAKVAGEENDFGNENDPILAAARDLD
jgi:hypothetical protein